MKETPVSNGEQLEWLKKRMVILPPGRNNDGFLLTGITRERLGDISASFYSEDGKKHDIFTFFYREKRWVRIVFEGKTFDFYEKDDDIFIDPDTEEAVLWAKRMQLTADIFREVDEKYGDNWHLNVWINDCMRGSTSTETILGIRPDVGPATEDPQAADYKEILRILEKVKIRER